MSYFTFSNATQDQRRAFALDVHLGLSAPQKFIPSKYFYDENGSKLFQRITELNEYYLTRAEAEILKTHKESLSQYFASEPFALVEMGAGDGEKTKILLEHFLAKGLDFHYAPIDISESALSELEVSLSEQFPTLSFQGRSAEYASGVSEIDMFSETRTVLLFLGSSIGNFSFPEMKLFLKTLWHGLNKGDFALIGFDLKKDIKTMQAAYDDKEGITKAFNLNLLHRINRELGGTFNVEKFYHHEIYNPKESAMESYLISLEAQEVYIDALKTTYRFEPYEAIFTERSYKFSDTSIRELAHETGFEIVETFKDSRQYFADSLWRVVK
ncbi:MAG: L-histidine N(alpha)-methyltransferase [Chloroherpetonaceae bacterium]